MTGEEPTPATPVERLGEGDEASYDEPPVHPWRQPSGGPPISARTAILLVAMVFLAGVAIGYLLASTA